MQQQTTTNPGDIMEHKLPNTHKRDAATQALIQQYMQTRKVEQCPTMDLRGTNPKRVKS